MPFEELRDGHNEPHRPVAVELVGVGGWAVVLCNNSDGTHTEFRLVRGEEAGELLSCYEGENDR
jgi:hypothetical protein